jgi:outer membrane cobalamin receptor
MKPALRSRTVTLLASVTLAASLAAQTVPLAPVIVSAERIPIPRAESSSRLDLLDRADLAPYTIRDAYDALTLLPNVSVQRYGSASGEGTLSFYGQSAARFAPTKTVIALNGVPLNSGLIAETSLNLIPLALVARTEVVQGPASVAYGSNAMTGVVNFAPRAPVGYESEVSAGYGTWNSTDLSAYAGVGAANDYHIGFALQRRATDGHLQPSGRDDFSDSLAENLALFANKQLGATRLTLAALHYGWDRHSPSATLPGAAIRTATEQGARRHYHLGLTQTLSPNLSVSLTGWRNENRERSTPYLGTGGFAASQRTLNHGALLQLTWQTAANLFSAGAEYQNADLLNRLSSVRYRGRTRGLFAQDRLLLLENQLALTVGARFDTTSTSAKNDSSPKAGFAFTPRGARWTLRGSVAQAYKSPSFSELFNTTAPLGNTALTAQKFLVSELGTEFRPLPGLTLGATVYRAKLTDPIYPRSIPTPPFTLRFTNVTDATTTDGAYFTADYRRPGFSFGASYAYLDPGTATFHTARHTAKVHGAVTSHGFTFAGSLLHAAHRFWQDSFVDPTDDYTTVDLKLSYALAKNCDLSLSAENIFDERYATGATQNRVTTPPPGFNRWVGLDRPGRSITAGVTVRF